MQKEQGQPGMLVEIQAEVQELGLQGVIKNLGLRYSTQLFLEERDVDALARHEYVLLRDQASSEVGAFAIKYIMDQSLVERNPEALVEDNSKKLQEGIESALSGVPTFFAISNYRHWAIIALLPSSNGELKVFYMNSAYGRGGESYFGCKLVGLTLCKNVINQINAVPLSDGGIRKPISADHIYLEQTQQVENNCGAVAALNIAAIAVWHRDSAKVSLEGFLGSLEYNAVLSSSNKKQNFEQYIKACCNGDTVGASSNFDKAVLLKAAMNDQYHVDIEHEILRAQAAMEALYGGQQQEPITFDIALQQAMLMSYKESKAFVPQAQKSLGAAVEAKSNGDPIGDYTLMDDGADLQDYLSDWLTSLKTELEASDYHHNSLEEHFANYAKNHIQQPAPVMFSKIMELTGDLRYLDFFKRLSGIVSDNVELQEDFWRLITGPIRDQITYVPEINEFFMHMLSAAHENRASLAKRIDEQISNDIKSNPTKYGVEIRRSGYINADIVKALFDLIGSKAPLDIREQALGILEGIKHKIPLYKSDNAQYSFELLFEILNGRLSAEETVEEFKEDQERTAAKPSSENSWKIEFYKLDLLDCLIANADEGALQSLLSYIDKFFQTERSSRVENRVKFLNIMLKHSTRINKSEEIKGEIAYIIRRSGSYWKFELNDADSIKIYLDALISNIQDMYEVDVEFVITKLQTQDMVAYAIGRFLPLLSMDAGCRVVGTIDKLLEKLQDPPIVVHTTEQLMLLLEGNAGAYAAQLMSGIAKKLQDPVIVARVINQLIPLLNDENAGHSAVQAICTLAEKLQDPAIAANAIEQLIPLLKEGGYYATQAVGEFARGLQDDNLAMHAIEHLIPLLERSVANTAVTAISNLLERVQNPVFTTHAIDHLIPLFKTGRLAEKFQSPFIAVLIIDRLIPSLEKDPESSVVVIAEFVQKLQDQVVIARFITQLIPLLQVVGGAGYYAMEAIGGLVRKLQDPILVVRTMEQFITLLLSGGNSVQYAARTIDMLGENLLDIALAEQVINKLIFSLHHEMGYFDGCRAMVIGNIVGRLQNHDLVVSSIERLVPFLHGSASDNAAQAIGNIAKSLQDQNLAVRSIKHLIYLLEGRAANSAATSITNLAAKVQDPILALQVIELLIPLLKGDARNIVVIIIDKFVGNLQSPVIAALVIEHLVPLLQDRGNTAESAAQAIGTIAKILRDKNPVVRLKEPLIYSPDVREQTPALAARNIEQLLPLLHGNTAESAAQAIGNIAKSLQDQNLIVRSIEHLAYLVEGGAANSAVIAIGNLAEQVQSQDLILQIIEQRILLLRGRARNSAVIVIDKFVGNLQSPVIAAYVIEQLIPCIQGDSGGIIVSAIGKLIGKLHGVDFVTRATELLMPLFQEVGKDGGYVRKLIAEYAQEQPDYDRIISALVPLFVGGDTGNNAAKVIVDFVNKLGNSDIAACAIVKLIPVLSDRYAGSDAAKAIGKLVANLRDSDAARRIIEQFVVLLKEEAPVREGDYRYDIEIAISISENLQDSALVAYAMERLIPFLEGHSVCVAVQAIGNLAVKLKDPVIAAYAVVQLIPLLQNGENVMYYRQYVPTAIGKFEGSLQVADLEGVINQLIPLLKKVNVEYDAASTIANLAGSIQDPDLAVYVVTQLIPWLQGNSGYSAIEAIDKLAGKLQDPEFAAYVVAHLIPLLERDLERIAASAIGKLAEKLQDTVLARTIEQCLSLLEEDMAGYHVAEVVATLADKLQDPVLAASAIGQLVHLLSGHLGNNIVKAIINAAGTLQDTALACLVDQLVPLLKERDGDYAAQVIDNIAGKLQDPALVVRAIGQLVPLLIEERAGYYASSAIKKLVGQLQDQNLIVSAIGQFVPLLQNHKNAKDRTAIAAAHFAVSSINDLVEKLQYPTVAALSIGQLIPLLKYVEGNAVNSIVNFIAKLQDPILATLAIEQLIPSGHYFEVINDKLIGIFQEPASATYATEKLIPLLEGKAGTDAARVIGKLAENSQNPVVAAQAIERIIPLCQGWHIVDNVEIIANILEKLKDPGLAIRVIDHLIPLLEEDQNHRNIVSAIGNFVAKLQDPDLTTHAVARLMPLFLEQVDAGHSIAGQAIIMLAEKLQDSAIAASIIGQFVPLLQKEGRARHCLAAIIDKCTKNLQDPVLVAHVIERLIPFLKEEVESNVGRVICELKENLDTPQQATEHLITQYKKWHIVDNAATAVHALDHNLAMLVMKQLVSLLAEDEESDITVPAVGNIVVKLQDPAMRAVEQLVPLLASSDNAADSIGNIVEKLQDPGLAAHAINLIFPLLESDNRDIAARTIISYIAWKLRSPYLAERAMEQIIIASEWYDDEGTAIAAFNINERLLGKHHIYHEIMLKKAKQELQAVLDAKDTNQLGKVLEYFSYFHQDLEIRQMISDILSNTPVTLLAIESKGAIARLSEYREFDSIIDKAFITLIRLKDGFAVLRNQMQNIEEEFVRKDKNVGSNIANIIYEYMYGYSHKELLNKIIGFAEIAKLRFTMKLHGEIQYKGIWYSMVQEIDADSFTILSSILYEARAVAGSDEIKKDQVQVGGRGGDAFGLSDMYKTLNHYGLRVAEVGSALHQIGFIIDPLSRDSEFAEDVYSLRGENLRVIFSGIQNGEGTCVDHCLILGHYLKAFAPFVHLIGGGNHRHAVLCVEEPAYRKEDLRAKIIEAIKTIRKANAISYTAESFDIKTWFLALTKRGNEKIDPYLKYVLGIKEYGELQAIAKKYDIDLEIVDECAARKAFKQISIHTHPDKTLMHDTEIISLEERSRDYLRAQELSNNQQKLDRDIKIYLPIMSRLHSMHRGIRVTGAILDTVKVVHNPNTNTIIKAIISWGYIVENAYGKNLGMRYVAPINMMRQLYEGDYIGVMSSGMLLAAYTLPNLVPIAPALAVILNAGFVLHAAYSVAIDAYEFAFSNKIPFSGRYLQENDLLKIKNASVNIQPNTECGEGCADKPLTNILIGEKHCIKTLRAYEKLIQQESDRLLVSKLVPPHNTTDEMCRLYGRNSKSVHEGFVIYDCHTEEVQDLTSIVGKDHTEVIDQL